MTNRRLYRSSENSQIAGVCGGLGEYLNVDPTLIRLAFLLMFVMGGPGLLLYIILWVVMPKAPDYDDEEYFFETKRKRKNEEFHEDF